MHVSADMARTTLLLCVTLGVCTTGVISQVASLCKPYERLLPCGCPKTCREPAPDCAGVCKMGCYCEEGEVRNDNGDCVKLADCPPIAAAYKLDTSEPRLNGGQCPENEEYRFCEPCNKTCAKPNPMCRAQCASGCFCKGSLLRDADGSCVKLEKCSNVPRHNEKLNFIMPIPYKIVCGKHQTYKPCEACERTCSNPALTCKSTCESGCFCLEGFVKAPSGDCVKLNDCPKAEVTLGNVQELSIEDCSPDEEFLSCGWCEPSCSDPTPSCPAGVCTRGCLCRPPLLRHRSGHCVQAKDCTSRICPNQNEEYVCRYGCEPRCDTRVCNARPRTCILGCHCKLGFIRDITTKLCVQPVICYNYTNVTHVKLTNLT